MKKNQFIITENEKKQILNLYKNRGYQTLISEQYSGEKAQGYNGNVAACKKDGAANVAAKAGLNWVKAKQSWGSAGTVADNTALKNAICDGWRPGDAKDGGGNTGAAVAGGGGDATSSFNTGGVALTDQPGCVRVPTDGSYAVNETDQQKNLNKFIAIFNKEISKSPILLSSIKKNSVTIRSVKIKGGASNVINSSTVTPDLMNDRITPYSGKDYTSKKGTPNYNGDLKLATDRAQNLWTGINSWLPSIGIKLEAGVQADVKGYVIDTGGKEDKYRVETKYPLPGQFVMTEFVLCGVEIKEEPKQNLTTQTTTETITETEFIECFQKIEIDVSFDKAVRDKLMGNTGNFPDLKFHNCDAAVFEVFANGELLTSTTNENFANLKNYNTKNTDQSTHKFNGVDKISKFVLNSETNKDKIQRMWQDAQAKKDYTGNINISLRCGPADAIGSDPNSKSYGGGCHKGVGHVVVRNGGQEVANIIQGTPQGLGQAVQMNPIEACKLQEIIRTKQQTNQTQGAQNGGQTTQNLRGGNTNQQGTQMA
jgi:hypothetical protein